MECLQRLTDCLTDCLMQMQKSGGGRKCHNSRAEVIEGRLRVIVSRSKEALTDFGEFYCLRLVLDLHSPLASFFIALFSHLEFLLVRLHFILGWDTVRDTDLIENVCLALSILKPVTTTCRLLYAICNMLPCMMGAVPATHVDEGFKRQGQRQGRRFSSNLPHCRMQNMAFVPLDQPGCSRVKLVQNLGGGTFATVYKGIFELPPADNLSHKPSRPGPSVAVKMFKKDDDQMFGSQLHQSLQQMTNHDLIQEEHDSVILAELEKLIIAKHPNIVTPMGYIGERTKDELPEGKCTEGEGTEGTEGERTEGTEGERTEGERTEGKRTEVECGLVMELMDESLSDYLEKVRKGSIPPLKEVDMLDLMLEIARGMQFLHECKLIHLDLKPQNILLRFSDGHDCPPQVKIADLGLTKLSSLFQKEMNVCREQKITAHIGTSCYMAPELRQASPDSAECDEKVDVFSFGTTCFNILLGNPDAWACAGSIKNFYAAIEAGKWQEWVQGCSPFLVKLIGRCWEKDPRMRPTFATLCVILIHALETHLVANVADHHQILAAFLHLEINLRQHFGVNKKSRWHRGISTPVLEEFCWSEYHRYGKKLEHLRIYAAIYLDLITRGVSQFRSHVDANRDVLSLDTLFHPWVHDNSTNKRITFCTFKQWKSGLQRGDSSKSLEELHVRFQTTMMENSLDAADPLVFFKVQAYINVVMFYDSSIWEVGALKESIKRDQDDTDFSMDAAHAPLQVDTSLISLLISFWNSMNLALA